MQIEEGAILNGKITGLTDFGAFVELEGGKTGMVHISEVSNTYVKDIKERLSVNQEVRVIVIAVSPEGRVSLSMKRIEQASNQPQRQPQRPQASGQQKPHTRSNERRSSPPVWNGPKTAPSGGEQSFEDMMSRFKQVSDEKMTDLKRSSESKHGGGYSRRGSGGGRQN